MASNEMFGWDLLYKIIENDIKQESDVIIAIAHWSLIKNSDVRCLGVGEDKTLSADETGNELLPQGWNDNENSYALRYSFNERLYILLGTISEESIILNLLDVKTLKVSNAAFHLKDTVKSLKGPISTLVPSLSTVLGRLKKELFELLFLNTTQTVETQTTKERPQSPLPRSEYDPLAYPPRRPLHFPSNIDPDSVRDIGRGDLDPFGRGGGMIFNPPGLNYQPPGLIFPDGRRPNPARFDPIYPVDANNRTRMGPDNDHFRPPGYDDMFM